MTKAHSESILTKLKTALPKSVASPTLPTVSAPPPHEPRPSAPLSKAVQKGRGLRYPKISVSLYQADIARLDEIKQFMREQGVRNLTDSEALRLACRAVTVGEPFIGLSPDSK